MTKIFIGKCPGPNGLTDEFTKHLKKKQHQFSTFIKNKNKPSSSGSCL
jgi:hypothetical protein